MTTIQGNKIVYDKHIVELDPRVCQDDPTYMQQMLDELSPNGDAAQHTHELEMMNNDGSWTVYAKENKK